MVPMRLVVLVSAGLLAGAVGAVDFYRLTFEMNRPESETGRGLTAAVTGAGSTLVTDRNVGWVRRSYVFRAVESEATRPHEPKFGVYATVGPIPTRQGKAERVRPRYAKVGEGELGGGELLIGNRYSSSMAQPDPTHLGTSRSLVRAEKTSFNTDRWCLEKDSVLVWRYALGGRRLQNGTFSLFCRRWYGGRYAIEVSEDGCAWERLGTVTTNSFDASLPARLFPADAVWVRLSGDGVKGTRALLTESRFEADVTGEKAFVRGMTAFAAEGESVPDPVAELPWQYRTMGARLPQSDECLGLWTVSSGWKVPRMALPLPKPEAKGVGIRTARNEAEARQLVLSPTETLEDVVVTAEGLPDGLNAEVLRVGYCNVEVPTDGICIRGPVADPLPPQTPGLAVRAGENQPFWVRVRPAKSVKGGLYRGRLVVEAMCPQGGRERRKVRREVPLAVEVFDFEFPDAVTIRSLFNVSLGDVNLYHNAKTQEDRERLEDIYLQALDENHLSPFRWTQYTKWDVSWKDGEPTLETAAFDRAMARVKAKYHFNSFRVSGFNSALCCNDFGLGKASALQTVPAELCGFRDGDSEYEVRVARLLRAAQEHFRREGYLREAVFYCFDEPKPEAIGLVQRGYARLRKYAPDFRSIITAPISKDLLGGPHIWCPTPDDYEGDLQRERQAAGDEFWTYLCMGPKAPWVTLFPDHPAVDLRTWLWQSWAKGCRGVLIWTTTLWNGAANRMPKDVMQNPYVDPMSYCHRGGVYGNGDGRLFYPPYSTVGRNGTDRIVARPAKDAPCSFERPVTSVRLEMLRDGIEDYEYHVMLRELDPGNPLLEVPKTVFRTLSDYNFDPTPMDIRRVEIAREIMRLKGTGK